MVQIQDRYIGVKRRILQTTPFASGLGDLYFHTFCVDLHVFGDYLRDIVLDHLHHLRRTVDAVGYQKNL